MSGFLRYNKDSKVYLFLGVQFVSFDKCIQSCNHHHNQDIDYFHLPKSFLLTINFAFDPFSVRRGSLEQSGEVKSNLFAINLQ